MAKFRRLALTLVLIPVAHLALAGDFLFLNPTYLTATRAVVSEAKMKAPAVFKDTETLQSFTGFADTLDNLVADKQLKQALKKVKSEDVEQSKDAAFAKALNDFKDGLNAMGDATGQPLENIVPSYDRWSRLETAVVKSGLEQRLAAYQTRFGPDSEQINILEFVVSQKFFTGDESGPDAWEPIFRITPVQLTSSGNGLASTAQVGMNYYFVHASPPKLFKLLGVSNHIGVAAAVQYLDDPGLFKYKGKPSFGAIVHLDRKEAGFSWDPTSKRVRVMLGYAFQFIPFAI